MEKLSRIDQAIADAKANKARNGGPKLTDGGQERPNGAARVIASEAEKAKARAEKEASRAAAKAKRDQERDERRAAKLAEKKPAHMSKVERAGAKLPKLTDTMRDTFDNITTNFERSEIAALAEHLNFFNRVKATEAALGAPLAVDDIVEIVSGQAQYIGQVGTVTKASRIRCYVYIEDLDKEVYLFRSDVVRAEDLTASEFAPSEGEDAVTNEEADESSDESDEKTLGAEVETLPESNTEDEESSEDDEEDEGEEQATGTDGE